MKWFGFAVGLLAASGCGPASQDVSPVVALQDLPGRSIQLKVSRGFYGLGDGNGVRVTVTIAYETGLSYCGTLKSPGATLGRVKLTVLSAGLKSFPSYLDGGMRCDFPTFQMDYGTGGAQGPLEVTDGITTARVEYDAVDPGASVLMAPTDRTLHPGQSARWHLDLPAGAGLSAYRVPSDLTVEDWAKGTATPAGGDVVAAIPASVPASYSGTGSLSLDWTLNAHVTSCSAGFACEVSSVGTTWFPLSIHP